MKRYFMVVILAVTLLCAGCRERQPVDETEDAPGQAMQQETPRKPGCQGCHHDIRLDSDHRLDCTECHLGNNDTAERESAHLGMVASPADSGQMERTCGRCHAKEVESSRHSLHFTLNNAVNLTRAAFGIQESLASLMDIPEVDHPVASVEQLVDDMLRRRCLRCHLHTSGDEYALVARGRGCASCHLQFTNGHLTDHTFVRPTDRQCLSCHYGNRVGADYHGLYEHDYNWEYRTPYTTTSPFVRPYGIEQHELAPDIHQQRGLVCIDCHDGRALMGTADKDIHCITCHGWQPGEPVPSLSSLQQLGSKLVVVSRADSDEHPVPALGHPAHRRYGIQVDCQVCHAQWSFNDAPTHLLLTYDDDIDEWARLVVQSSSEVESWLDHNLNSDEEEWEPAMTDQLTGRKRPGIWFQGYGQRRWEDLLIRRDDNGRIRVFRPLLDLRLSGVDANGEVMFDNIASSTGLLPYTPHTTGPAGLFFKQRFSRLLPGPEPGPRK